jgi:hypothetical protein
LANESVLFEQAYTVAPLTLPAHASMLTGLYPLRHGVRDNVWWPLSPAADLLAERARAQGFQTAAFISSLALDKSFGLDRGFEIYDQPPRQAHQSHSHFAERPAPAVVRAAQESLGARDRSRPFFLWVHFFDPHAPYEAPEGYGGTASHPYLREVAFMDAALGALVEGLRADGILDESLLVVAGDHGEALGEHGELTHGAFCYASVLRVPLIVRLPGGRRAGERSRALASVVDVFPTSSPLSSSVARGISTAATSCSWERARAAACTSSPTRDGFPMATVSSLAGSRTAASTFTARRRSCTASTLIREQRNEFVTSAPQVERARAEIAELGGLPRLPDTRGREPDAGLTKALSALGYSSAGAARADLPEPLESSDRPARGTRRPRCASSSAPSAWRNPGTSHMPRRSCARSSARTL